jgi:hypothetical protein
VHGDREADGIAVREVTAGATKDVRSTIRATDPRQAGLRPGGREARGRARGDFDTRPIEAAPKDEIGHVEQIMAARAADAEDVE